MSDSEGPRTTRRRFLALLGTGAGWTALAGTRSSLVTLAQLRATPAGAETTSASAALFDDRERRLLGRIMERMVGAGEEGLPPVASTRAVARLEAVCSGLDPELTRPLPALLRLVDWGPLIFDLSWPRFSSASDIACDAALRSWMESRLALRRQAFLALRNLSFLGYYSQPETWPAIGYAGPLLGDTDDTGDRDRPALGDRG